MAEFRSIRRRAMTCEVIARPKANAHTARMKASAAHLVTASLVLAALFHLLTGVGLLGAQRLAALYGVAIPGDDLLLLMRHRALLFAILGGFMLHAAWSPPLQWWALGAGLVSTAGFIALCAGTAWVTPALRTVMWIDVGLFVALLAALVARLVSLR
jgi:hypothetical protein